jgi:hypothetical protein
MPPLWQATVRLTKYDDEGHLDTLDLGSGNKAT